ncbi:hypothetical protein D3C83_100760 [compost metagenome]
MRACAPPNTILASSQRRSAAGDFHSSGRQFALGKALRTSTSRAPSDTPLAS